MPRKVFLTLGALWMAAACADPAAPPDVPSALAAVVSSAHVELVDLGVPFGAPGANANAINARGDVGGATGGGPFAHRSFLWSERGGFTDLGAVGLNNQATGVNASGTVVGFAGASDAVVRSFAWDHREGLRDLLGPTVGPNQAWGINARGDVVGNLGTRGFVVNDPLPFVWNERGGLTLIPLLTGWLGANAIAVNNAGVVVGEAKVTNPASPSGWSIHAFQWTKQGGTLDLGQVSIAAGPTGLAAINERGQAVGTMIVGGQRRAIFWSAGTGIVDIHPDGMLHSQAMDINDRGQVVGVYTVSTPSGTSGRAYIRSAAGLFTELPGLSSSGSVARAVNEAGEIVGSSVDEGGQVHPVLWRVRGLP